MTDLLARLRGDFALYAKVALRIRTKSGAIEPLLLNRAQLYVHERLERQRATRGYVRAIVLKGRQQGMSTYIGARFFWRASGEFGKKVGILTHLDDATKNLFGMVQRYYDHLPIELKPATKNNSANELNFAALDSGYSVATAGSKAVGRSATIQLMHGSEVAFWPNADQHMMGIGQTIPLLPGTEIVLESTANGIGNWFHNAWQRAESGESEYEAIFVPWFWQPEYRMEPKPGFRLTEEEDEYAAAHDLDMHQMAWRRMKINDDFEGDALRFQQEYPATAAEAFVAVGVESYIPTREVLVARKALVRDPYGALVVGVDPARFGDDSTAIVRRRGRKAYKPERLHNKDTMQIAGRVALLIAEEKPAKVFIDVGGLGAGVVDRLVEMGYGRIVQGVNFGERALDEAKYTNKRAEMWALCRQWLRDQPAEIPDDDVLHGDLIGPQYDYDSLGRLKLEPKEKMRKRGVKSPDLGDALALTFAFPVQADDKPREKWRDRLRAHTAGSGGSPMSA